MNPIEKALAQADKIVAANAELERITREAPHSLLQQQPARVERDRLVNEERQTLVITYDVTGWSEEQINYLVGEAWAQGEASDGHGDVEATADAVYTHPADITVHDAVQIGLGF